MRKKAGESGMNQYPGFGSQRGNSFRGIPEDRVQRKPDFKEKGKKGGFEGDSLAIRTSAETTALRRKGNQEGRVKGREQEVHPYNAGKKSSTRAISSPSALWGVRRVRRGGARPLTVQQLSICEAADGEAV